MHRIPRSLVHSACSMCICGRRCTTDSAGKAQVAADEPPGYIQRIRSTNKALPCQGARHPSREEELSHKGYPAKSSVVHTFPSYIFAFDHIRRRTLIHAFCCSPSFSVTHLPVAVAVAVAQSHHSLPTLYFLQPQQIFLASRTIRVQRDSQLTPGTIVNLIQIRSLCVWR